MWMIVIVAVASGEVVYVDSAANSNFFRSEKSIDLVRHHERCSLF